MTHRITLRRAGATDSRALADIMYVAVRHGSSRYSEPQREAWVPERRSGADWDARLAGQTIIIAEVDDAPVGFMSLEAPDYVDFAFIRPAWQGKGIFRRLHDAIEGEARARGQVRLHTHASLMAQPAFTAMGYAITAPETVEIRGQSFQRFAMEKRLEDAIAT